jgi:hypothetical protein
MSDATMIQNRGGMGVSADEWLPPTTKIRIPLLSALHCSVVFCLQAETKLWGVRGTMPACLQAAS